jgi:hypothetical protein
MKYEFTGEVKLHFGITMKQIRRIADKLIGGWIQDEKNLDQSGSAWVYGDAQVSGDARVSGDAQVYGDARVLWVSKIGSRLGTTTFCIDKKLPISVSCGCFFGSIDEFEKKVIATHKGTKHEAVYLAAIAMARAQLGDSK